MSADIAIESLLLGSKKKENGEKEHMSRQYRVWIDHLTRSLHECMPLEESYVLLHTANMVGLFTCVFVKHKERHNITKISASEIKRGMGGLHGNKVCDAPGLCYGSYLTAAGCPCLALRPRRQLDMLCELPFGGRPNPNRKPKQRYCCDPRSRVTACRK